MDIPISAGTELDDLARRVQAGEEVVLTRDGAPAVRLAPVEVSEPRETNLTWHQMTPQERRVQLEALVAGFRDTPNDGISAAHSQDFLYGWDGLPR